MATKVTDGPAVAVADLAGELGLPLESVVEMLDRERVRLVTDWRGRPAVPEAAAAALVARVRAERAAHDEAWAAYQSWIKDRERERRRVFDQAFREALEDERRREIRALRGDEVVAFALPSGYTASTAARSRARARAAEAVEAWDKRNPALDFEAWRKKARS